ncbi:hypothetical protein DPMN_045998 [Dreissena polymorpha]|uniref:Uncharacterized protein n=1 Tax=Dreissena polymorpha TaxID=45954 RepID=A0A9D4I1V8_DREPO|nr:hypothetical protein DPMN_045998 [Dreissena polymorpha]
MSSPEETHPDVYRKFVDGFYVFLRSTVLGWTLLAPVTFEHNCAMHDFTHHFHDLAHNTKTQLRRASKEILPIPRKCKHRSKTAHPTQLILL